MYNRYGFGEINNKNPNFVSSNDIEQSYAEGKATNAFNRVREREISRVQEEKRLELGYKSIFDQCEFNPDAIQKPLMRDDESVYINSRNPNFMSADDIAYTASSDKATIETNQILALNRALKNKEYDLAELILGRKLREDDIKPVSMFDPENVYFKTNNSVGEIYRTFNVREISSLKSYTSALDDIGTGYRVDRDRDNNYIVISGPSIEKVKFNQNQFGSINLNVVKRVPDVPLSAGPQSQYIKKDPFKILKDFGVMQGRTSSISMMRKSVLLETLSAFGFTDINDLSNIELRSLLTNHVNQSDVYSQLQSRNKSRFSNPVVDESLSSSESDVKRVPIEITFSDSDDESESPVLDASEKKDSSIQGKGVKSKKSKKKPTKGGSTKGVPTKGGPINMNRILMGNMTSKKLQNMMTLYMGEIDSGNDSKELKNDLSFIMGSLHDKCLLSKKKMNQITKRYITKK